MTRVEIRRHSPVAPWSYSALDARQREIARGIADGDAGALLLSEVAPVVTVGRRTPQTDLLIDRLELARTGVDVITVDRGGLATWHGPGQWVAFVVDRLDRLVGDPRGVRAAVDGLLASARAVCARYGCVTESRSGGELGLWSDRGKIASVGVHVSGGVLLHGIALNVRRHAQSFAGIRPCGLDLPVDWLEERSAMRPIDFDQLALDWIEEISAVFRLKTGAGVHLDATHPSGYTLGTRI